MIMWTEIRILYIIYNTQSKLYPLEFRSLINILSQYYVHEDLPK